MSGSEEGLMVRLISCRFFAYLWFIRVFGDDSSLSSTSGTGGTVRGTQSHAIRTLIRFFLFEGLLYIFYATETRKLFAAIDTIRTCFLKKVIGKMKRRLFH